MSTPTFTRRAAIIGAIASSAALALPVAAAVTPDEPAGHIDDLVRQLSTALTAEYGGDFECTVGPAGAVSYRWAAMPASERFHQHFDGMVDALDQMTGDADGWTMQCGRNHAGGVFHNLRASYLVNEEILNKAGLPIGTLPVDRHSEVSL